LYAPSERFSTNKRLHCSKFVVVFKCSCNFQSIPCRLDRSCCACWGLILRSRRNGPSLQEEVAKIFYTEFIPEAERLMPGVTADVMNSDYHKWTKGVTKEQLQQQIDFYKERYKQ